MRHIGPGDNGSADHFAIVRRSTEAISDHCLTYFGSGDPCRVGVAMTDIATGLYVHGAIMGALFNRERTGGIGAAILLSNIFHIFFRDFCS